jgi:hypothetical protein
MQLQKSSRSMDSPLLSPQHRDGTGRCEVGSRSMPKLYESLYLYLIHLNSEVSCRAVATTEVQYPELEECQFEDGRAAQH